MLRIAGRSQAPRSEHAKWQRATLLILGSDYDLSLILIGDRTSRRLNRLYRQHDRATNVLAFPLEKKLGEIFLNWAQARREAKANGETARQRLFYLFIHGLLHLKGYRHGSRMETKEVKMLNLFGYGQKDNRRT